MGGRQWIKGLPVLVTLLAAGLTWWAWWQTEKGRADLVQLAFQREALRLEQHIRERVDHYVSVLQAGQGFLQASETVSPAEWLSFAAAIGLPDRYPGIEAMVFYQYVDDADLAALSARQTAIWGTGFGISLPPGFTTVNDHLIATLVAPGRLIGALRGLDFAGEETRRQSAFRARDEGRAVMTPVLDLVTPAATGTDSVGLMPVYATPAVPSTVQGRRDAFRGVVAVGFDLSAILNRALQLSPPDLHIDVYDSAAPGAGDARGVARNRLIYHHGPVVEKAVLSQTLEITIDQRLWRLDVRAGDGFVAGMSAREARPLFLIVGLFGSVLLGLLAWLLVTRRQQAQELADRMTAALQDSEERYRQLFVGNRAVELLIDPEREGQIVDANAAAARFYGWTVDELRQMRISDINTLTADEVKAEMANAAAERRDHFLFRHRTARGDLRDVEVHSGPVPLGSRQLLYSIIHDVTERRRAEQAQAVSEARFRALFEDSPLAIQVVDPDGRTVRANAAWRVLWQRDPATEKGDGPLDDPQLVRAGVADHLREAYRGSTVEIPPFRYVLASDVAAPVRWIRAYAYPIRDPSGPEHQLIIVWENVTEKLTQEQRLRDTMGELERSNGDLEQFAYVASHDLQEPLRMISSYIGLLERRYGRDMKPEALEFMGYAVDGAHRMQDIINDLLTYSRVGRKGRPFGPCAIGNMAQVARDTLAVAIEEAGAEVIIAEDMPVVMGDAHELARLFQNLLGNAVKYARPDVPPRIRVDCAPAGNDWRITVTDNGIGVAPEFHERIFQIFQRLHSRSAYSGTGVGLAICKKIVERHGGRIGIEPVEGGSRFWFTLPRMDALQADATPLPKKQPATP